MKKIIIVLALLTCISTLKAQNNLSEKDKKFIQEAAQGSLMEVRLGELAQTNSTSSEVKNLGQQMINDHSKAESQLKLLARTRNISISDELSEKQQIAYNKLSKKYGDEFDKAYTKCMVNDHKKDICNFKSEAKHGTDTEIISWASNTVSILERHKQMSVEACKTVHKK